jgi:hypothetical protein
MSFSHARPLECTWCNTEPIHALWRGRARFLRL